MIYSLLLIYGIKKLKLVGLRLERFDPEYSPLIPGYYCVGVNMHAKVRDAIKDRPKIVTWDQSLLTVSINTRTRVKLSEVASSKSVNKCKHRPRVA